MTQAEANWASPNGNQFGQDYNPQTQINSSNVQYLGLSWLFPLPTHPAALASITSGFGVDTAPLIVNGTIYAVTQFDEVFAINAATGNVVWTDILPITANSTAALGVAVRSLHAARWEGAVHHHHVPQHPDLLDLSRATTRSMRSTRSTAATS